MTAAALIVQAMHGDLDRFQRQLKARSLRLTREAMGELRDKLDDARLGQWGIASNIAAATIARDAIDKMQARQAAALGVGLPAVARRSQARQVALLSALDAKYQGSVRPLRFDSLAWLETQTTEQIRLRQFPRSFARYGAVAVREIEDELAKLALTGRSWTEARGRVHAAIRGVVGGRQWMVDRIIRTETAAIYNGTALAAMEAEDTPDNPMMKRLVATFDTVTGWDSRAVHGQLRRVRDPFQDPKGRLYQAPPNRPHDREIVVPHRAAWGERVEHLGGPRGEAAEETSEPEALPAPPPAPRVAKRRPNRAIAVAAASVLLAAGRVGEQHRQPAPEEDAAPRPRPVVALAELERARVELAAARLAADLRAREGIVAGTVARGERLSAGGIELRIVSVAVVPGGLRIVAALGDTRLEFVSPARLVLPLRRVAPTLKPSSMTRSLAVAAVVLVLRSMTQERGDVARTVTV